jgi:hypothetical protein
MVFDKDFKKNFKIEGYMSATTFTSVVDGRKYAVSGGNWIHIPNDMTFDEVRSAWVDLRVSLVKENHKDLIKEVKSSKGKSSYKVFFQKGSWSCTCSGYGFRRKCSHIDSVKKELKDSILA